MRALAAAAANRPPDGVHGEGVAIHLLPAWQRLVVHVAEPRVAKAVAHLAGCRTKGDTNQVEGRRGGEVVAVPRMSGLPALPFQRIVHVTSMGLMWMKRELLYSMLWKTASAAVFGVGNDQKCSGGVSGGRRSVFRPGPRTHAAAPVTPSGSSASRTEAVLQERDGPAQRAVGEGEKDDKGEAPRRQVHELMQGGGERARRGAARGEARGHVHAVRGARQGDHVDSGDAPSSRTVKHSITPQRMPRKVMTQQRSSM